MQIVPTGDRSAHSVAQHQPSAFAGMEGVFPTQKGAPLVIIGNPNTETRSLESTLEMPHLLSFLTSRNWNERLTGLNDIARDRWPDSVPLVYYAYHTKKGSTREVAEAVAATLRERGLVFGGVVKPEKLYFPFSHMPKSDARDWGAVSTWTAEVAGALGAPAPA